MEVPTNAEPDRLQIAVAQILLHHVQDGLPEWAAITKDGEFVTNRRRHGRHKDARLRFNPKLLFSINWATSGPGFEWPEAYYVTYVPGLEKYVFTASRDGDDAWGCAKSPPGDRSVNDLDLLGVALMVKPFMLAGKAAASDAVWHLNRNGKASKAVTEGRSCWQSRRLCFV